MERPGGIGEVLYGDGTCAVSERVLVMYTCGSNCMLILLVPDERQILSGAGCQLTSPQIHSQWLALWLMGGGEASWIGNA